MLVYGDDAETVCPRRVIGEIEAAVAGLGGVARGLDWHAAAVEAFIRLAALAQGFADGERARLGHDDLSEGQEHLHAVLRGCAGAVHRSWRSEFADQGGIDASAVSGLRGLDWPEAVTLKRCEGYAFYALYPETYLAAAEGLAAEGLPGDCVVIGLRSIGTGLAALVAAAAGSETMMTLRPVGHPFARRIEAGAALEARVRGWAERRFAIVDEGPGLSGSSFGGTADWLEELGVAPERILFMPSHEGEPGGEAAPAHRARWARAEKRVRGFEQVIAVGEAAAPLAGWFEDVTGPLREAPVERSGGAWAAGREDVATAPSREARKYLLRGARGDFVAKFAGIDRAGREKMARAVALGEAGFGVMPAAMRYGFILEPFADGAAVAAVPEGHVVDYLRFRRERFAGRGGATLAALLEMARHNLGEAEAALGEAVEARWSAARVAALQPLVEPVHVDARLHSWEWLRVGERIVKTDAVDHSQAHDLVGCQDILWDVAGAGVELGLDDEGLAEAFTGGVAGRRELLGFLRIAYLAFQLGWWSMSGTAAGWERSLWYRERAAALLAVQG